MASISWTRLPSIGVSAEKSSHAIVFADETVVHAQTERNEARVADDETLQTQEFVEIEGGASGLTDRLTPARDARRRRPLALDGKARA